MAALLSALMMLGPGATELDEMKMREAFSQSLFMCTVSAYGPVTISVHEGSKITIPEHGYGICASMGAVIGIDGSIIITGSRSDEHSAMVR